MLPFFRLYAIIILESQEYLIFCGTISLLEVFSMSIDLLQEKIRQTKTPIMVGLDPTEDLIPLHILNAAFDEKGMTPEGLAEAYFVFCKGLLRISDVEPLTNKFIFL